MHFKYVFIFVYAYRIFIPLIYILLFFIIF